MTQITDDRYTAAQHAYCHHEPSPRTSGLAVASLVCGLLWFGWLGSLLALIFGYVARRDINASGGTLRGEGLANAGIWLGWLAFLAPIAILVGVSIGSLR